MTIEEAAADQVDKLKKGTGIFFRPSGCPFFGQSKFTKWELLKIA